MQFNWLLQVTVLTLVVHLSGCASSFSAKDDKELYELINAYGEYETKRQKKQEERLEQEIKTLEVNKLEGLFVVTTDLEKASIPEVVDRVFNDLDAFGIRYQFDNVKTFGNITTHFKNKPLLEALNLILESNWLIAEQQDNVIVIKNDATKGQEPVFQEIVLENIDVKTAEELVKSMFPSTGDDTTSDVQQGIIFASNTIYLRGAKSRISEVSQFLVKMDRKIPHVTIEVLVVEFNSEELEELGAKLQNFQDGKYSDVNLNYKNRSNIITFSKQLVDGGYSNFLTSFTAVVDILISKNKARLISRPYISTLSGQTAKIDITSDRYIIVDRENGASAPKSVPAGVVLTIKPVVLGKHKLRMDVNVEDSQFSSITPPNVSLETRKNVAQTIMQVEDGQTIIIGGLTSNRRASGNAGFPVLKDIPILNLFFANQSKNEREKAVMIYVTPHIVWEPGMDSRLVKPYILTDIDGKAKELYKKTIGDRDTSND